MRHLLSVTGTMLLAATLLLPTGGCGSGGTTTTTPMGSFIALTDFQPAAVVIGQADFMSGMSNQGGADAAANTLHRTLASANGSLWVADSQNNRVLRYATVPTANDASADLVLGQPDFVTRANATTATGMFAPFGISISGGKLFVGEFNNRRVLIWNTLPTTNGQAADVVVGQPDFMTATAGLTQTGGGNVHGVFAVDGRLIVCERENHRVLIWNTIPTTNGATADLVLGQPDFVSGMDNRGGAAAADTLSGPTTAWSDGTRLFVTDHGNHRVLVWNTFPTTNGEAADLALGQPDLTTAASAAGATGLFSPSHVSSNATQLFVCDAGNNRVLIWNTLPTMSGAPADGVLGQSDFVHMTANDDDQDNVSDATPSARTFNGDAALDLMGATPRGNQLIVNDHWNARVLIFNGM